MEVRFRVLDFIKLGKGVRYRIIDTESPNEANKNGVYASKDVAEHYCRAFNSGNFEPWTDPEHMRLTDLNAAHLVAASIILSKNRQATHSAIDKAKKNAKSATNNLEELGYLPDEIFAIEDNVPDYLAALGGKDVAIPHSTGGFRWRVKAAMYQEIFNAAYPDPWV